MGKALIIKGLVVNNPVCTVNFAASPLEKATAAFYKKNSSINDNEKIALDTFIQNLITAGLWNKVYYFYPMLGDNLSDIKLDVVSPLTDDIFANTPETGLSIINRTLHVSNRNYNGNYDGDSTVGERATSLNLSNISIISSGNFSNLAPNYSCLLLRSKAAGNLSFNDTGIDVYKQPACVYGNNNINSNVTTVNSNIKRIGGVSIYNNEAYVYDGEKISVKSAIIPITSPVTKTVLFDTYTRQEAEWNFLAITKGLTESEWKVFYTLLNQYLTKLNK